ncbi:ABC transporter permease, partial [Burkholderia sp. SIMBA_019]
GLAFGRLHGWLTVSLALSQHVAGLGVTMLATSVSYYAYRLNFAQVSSPPTITPFAPMTWWAEVPLLGPLIGPVMAAETALTLLALCMAPL